MCVATAQFWPEWVSGLLSDYSCRETLADYVLSPRIIGVRVKLNPVWLMFALFAFGYFRLRRPVDRNPARGIVGRDPAVRDAPIMIPLGQAVGRSLEVNACEGQPGRPAPLQR